MQGIYMHSLFTAAMKVVLVSSVLQASSHNFEYGDLCPYSSLCTTRPKETLKDTSIWPCCFPCFCSDTCEIYRNCCPDKSSPNISKARLPCKPQAQLYNQYLNRSQRNYGSAKYRVIDSCPQEALENDTLKETVSRCYHGNSLEDINFVSDLENEFVYFNKFCARCNGAYDIVPWSLKVDCGGANMFDFQSFVERDQYVINNEVCQIVSSPPTDNIGTAFFCTDNLIARCNVSGKWNFYDPELEENCRTHAIMYQDGGLYRQKVYANVYCFLCNMPKDTPTATQCTNPFTFSKGDVFYPFTAIMLAAPAPGSGVIKTNAGCRQDEMVDLFTVQSCKR